MYMEPVTEGRSASSSSGSTSAEMLGAGEAGAAGFESDSGGYDGEAFLCSLSCASPEYLFLWAARASE